MSAVSQWETAFLFPGQGSQYPGMARELGVCEGGAKELLEQAEEVTGLPVLELMTRADAAALADPEVAQVLVFVLSIALYEQVARQVGSPSVMAGHSLGEYTALVASGSLDRELGLRLVSARGKAMAAAAGQAAGSMAAIVGLPLEKVQALCEHTEDELGWAVVANLNSPKQAVVSGPALAIQDLLVRAQDAGALRARPLPVGGAYHSPLMATAEDDLRSLLGDARLAPPRTPMVSSVTAGVVTDIEDYRGSLLSQVTQPVRWEGVVSLLSDRGVETFVEVGPGRVLTGLSREMARAATCQSTGHALRGASSKLATKHPEGSPR